MFVKTEPINPIHLPPSFLPFYFYSKFPSNFSIYLSLFDQTKNIYFLLEFNNEVCLVHTILTDIILFLLRNITNIKTYFIFFKYAYNIRDKKKYTYKKLKQVVIISTSTHQSQKFLINQIENTQKIPF